MGEFTISGGATIEGQRLALSTYIASVAGALPVGFQPAAPYVATASGTIIGTQGGTLYGFAGCCPTPSGTIAGTLLLYMGSVGGSGQPLEFIFPPNQNSGLMFDRGIKYSGALVATLLGTLSVTFLD